MFHFRNQRILRKKSQLRSYVNHNPKSIHLTATHVSPAPPSPFERDAKTNSSKKREVLVIHQIKPMPNPTVLGSTEIPTERKDLSYVGHPEHFSGYLLTDNSSSAKKLINDMETQIMYKTRVVSSRVLALQLDNDLSQGVGSKRPLTVDTTRKGIIKRLSYLKNHFLKPRKEPLGKYVHRVGRNKPINLMADNIKNFFQTTKGNLSSFHIDGSESNGEYGLKERPVNGFVMNESIRKGCLMGTRSKFYKRQTTPTKHKEKDKPLFHNKLLATIRKRAAEWEIMRKAISCVRSSPKRENLAHPPTKAARNHAKTPKLQAFDRGFDAALGIKAKILGDLEELKLYPIKLDKDPPN